MRPNDSYKAIAEESEAEFLDNGGAMTIERRDYYFTRAMKALQHLEKVMQERDHAICWMTTCTNCAKLWDANYEMYCQLSDLKNQPPWPFEYRSSFDPF